MLLLGDFIKKVLSLHSYSIIIMFKFKPINELKLQCMHYAEFPVSPISVFTWFQILPQKTSDTK